MPSDFVDIRISGDSPDRRALIARFCDELGRALAPDPRWSGDETVVPWQASAATFEALPARVTEAILDEWTETEASLGAIEFGGYLETDNGPRAWGSLSVREGRPRTLTPELGACMVEPEGDGYRVEARLRLRVKDSAGA